MLTAVLSGCVSVKQNPVVHDSRALNEPEEGQDSEENIISGIYHTVKKGENLYRISKAYGISVEDIVNINSIPDVTDISVGTPLFIPGACEIKEVFVPSEVPTEEKTGPETVLCWPVQGRITSGYGIRNGRMHTGIDISAVKGTPVKAAEEGKVVFAGALSGYGNAVEIDHGNDLKTLYAHLLEYDVKNGDSVQKGQIIGAVGKSGRATGYHLHFEVISSSGNLNPMEYLN